MSTKGADARTGPLLSLAVGVIFQLSSGGASGQKRGHRPKNRHRAPTQATAYFFAGNPLVDSGGLSAPWFIGRAAHRGYAVHVEHFFLVFSVTLRGGATAPLELCIHLACSEGPFVPLGLKHLEGRGTICYSAVDGTICTSTRARMFRGTFRNSGTRAQRIFGKAGDARAWLDTPQPTRSTECEKALPEVLSTFSARAHLEDEKQCGACGCGGHALGSAFRYRDSPQRPEHKEDTTRDCCSTPHLHQNLCSAHAYTRATARRDSLLPPFPFPLPSSFLPPPFSPLPCSPPPPPLLLHPSPLCSPPHPLCPPLPLPSVSLSLSSLPFHPHCPSPSSHHCFPPVFLLFSPCFSPLFPPCSLWQQLRTHGQPTWWVSLWCCSSVRLSCCVPLSGAHWRCVASPFRSRVFHVGGRNSEPVATQSRCWRISHYGLALLCAPFGCLLEVCCITISSNSAPVVTVSLWCPRSSVVAFPNC